PRGLDVLLDAAPRDALPARGLPPLLPLVPRAADDGHARVARAHDLPAPACAHGDGDREPRAVPARAGHPRAVGDRGRDRPLEAALLRRAVRGLVPRAARVVPHDAEARGPAPD